MTNFLKRLQRSEDGATAVEFALYSTVFFAMLFGGIYMSFLGFSAASLQSATESAARCRAMGITCTDATTTQTYAATKFHSVAGSAPTFVSTTDTCGNKVTGSMTFSVKYILGTKAVSISSAACFPSQSASTT
jgi:Flp pilus assembly protein TadG